jgi:hypothetical protein
MDSSSTERFSWNRPTPLLATPRLLATARSYLSKDATIEMKVTKALTTGIAVLRSPRQQQALRRH